MLMSKKHKEAREWEYEKGKRDIFKEFLNVIKKDIKIWESDNKGKERYYGTTGCVVKVLEELKTKLEKLKC